MPNARLFARKKRGRSRGVPRSFARDSACASTSFRMTSEHSGSGVPPYLVLLRVGFALPAALLPWRCALTAPFHPYFAHRCGLSSGRHPEQALSAPAKDLGEPRDASRSLRRRKRASGSLPKRPCPNAHNDGRGGMFSVALSVAENPALNSQKASKLEWATRSRTLSGTLLCGVRTFLPAHSRDQPIHLVGEQRWTARMGGATVRSGCLRIDYSETTFDLRLQNSALALQPERMTLDGENRARIFCQMGRNGLHC
jgi:hypothetical protein